MEADGDAAADAAADAGADRRNRRAIAARMKRAADAAAAGRSVRPYGARGAIPEQHRQQHRHVPPSPLTRPSMAEVDVDEQDFITISYDHYLTLVRIAAQSVDEGASSSSSGGSLAWDVEKNLMLQYAADDEWRFGVDDQFASNDFGADEDEEHDEDEELRLALEVSLADMHVRDSQ